MKKQTKQVKRANKYRKEGDWAYLKIQEQHLKLPSKEAVFMFV